MRLSRFSGLLLAARLIASEANQMDGSLSLFTVTAALDAAGALPETDHPARKLLRQHLLARDVPVTPELKRFVIAHRQAANASNISQYISFALSHSEPPLFERRFHENQVPPDAASVADFGSLAARFYREAGIEELWKKVQPLVEQELARYQGPVSQALLEGNGYLRNPTSGYMGRRFLIYLDLLGATRQAQTRSYGDDYFVVVPPAAQPQTFDIRHAYFHHLIDPLATKYAALVDKKKSLIDFAAGAPLLQESYKEDFLLLTAESLIKAIESRLARRPEAALQAAEEGFVLAPFFAEQLALYEKQEAAMRLYFPDMIELLDVKKETRRLDKVKFAASRPPSEAPAIAAAPPAPPTAGQELLEEAERLAYSEKAYGRAREVYLKVLQRADDRTLHARAYYGMARIAAQEKNPELAEQLFRKTLELAPDAQTMSWSHVYLARLSELAGEPEEAARHFEAALRVEGASAQARQAAEQGLSKFRKN